MFNFGLFSSTEMAKRPADDKQTRSRNGVALFVRKQFSKKNAWKHADALAACLVVVVAHACGWLVFRLAGDAESEPCGQASQAWVTTSDVSVRHLRLASVAGMGVQ